MTEFQKSLTRFLYVALVLGVLATVWWASHTSRTQTAVKSAPRGQGVTATGTCVVRTKPELVEVTIGVKRSAKSAQEAHDYVKSRISRVIQLLKKGGVADKDIRTEYFSLSPNWVTENNKSYLVWAAAESLRVRIRKMDDAAGLIDRSIRAGANQIGGLQYTVDELNKLRAKGRDKAARIAREKARELASSLGGKLGRLTAVSENYPGEYGGWEYGGNVQYKYASGPVEVVPPSAEELTIQPGEFALNVAVTATYELK